MIYLVKFGAALLAILSVVCFLTIKERGSKRCLVHLPTFFGIIGLVCGWAFELMAFFAARQDPNACWIFLIILALDVCLPIAYINCTVEFDEQGFRARNLFGITYQREYSALDGIRDRRDCRIYFGRNSILIDQSAVELRHFIDTARKGYRKQTGKTLTVSPNYRRTGY